MYKVVLYQDESADEFAAATRKEMSDAKLPLQYRDSCAHLLIPLNKCRPAEWYLPWKCQVRPPAINAAPTDPRMLPGN